MKIRNKNTTVIYPLILAVVLIGGMLIGLKLKKTDNEPSFVYPNADKLSGILNFIEKEYVDPVSKKDLEEVAIPAMLQELDPHSLYIPAEELASITEPLEGNFEGIGIEFNTPNDTVVVIRTNANGPSDMVGILPGDRIVKINDTVVAGVNMPDDDIVKRLKGPRGTRVKVGVVRKNVFEILDFEITRDKIPLYSVDVSYMVNDKIGYIKISQFSRTTYQEFIDAIDKLSGQGLEKLILDLRRNGGGYMGAATEIANEFLEANTLIVYTEGKARPRSEIYSNSRASCLDYELIIILDELSASASEILAGAIQDNDRGTIIGRRSFGKGLVQEQVALSDGSALRLTIARYYTPTGRSIQKPYTNGTEEYFNDLNIRMMNREFETADSIHFADSLKFTTPGGKTVYGGGGIMPDIFIPWDSTGISNYLAKISNRGLVYRYAFDYVDKNREKLIPHKDYKEIKQYLETQNILNEFLDFAEKNGIIKDREGIEISGEVIKTQLYAYIARNMIGNDGFYPIIRDIDHTLNEGIQLFYELK